MTVSSIRLKWEMPHLPGINKHYRSTSFYHLTTFWHAQAWKTFALIYCFRILAAADGRDCVSQLVWTQDGNWQGVLIVFNHASWFVDPHVVLFDFTSKLQLCHTKTLLTLFPSYQERYMDSRVKVNTQGDGTISPARMQEARCLFGADQQTENWKGNPGPLLQVKKRHGRILRWRAIPQGKVTAFSMATETYCCR